MVVPRFVMAEINGRSEVSFIECSIMITFVADKNIETKTKNPEGRPAAPMMESIQIRNHNGSSRFLSILLI